MRQGEQTQYITGQDRVTGDSQQQGVRKRKVFYLPGYDPFPSRRYREMYRREAALQATTSQYQISVAGGPGGATWTAQAEMDGARTEAEIEVLEWSDLVRASMTGTISSVYGALVRTSWTYLRSGVLSQLIALRKGPVLAALYPVAMLIVQLLIALAAAYSYFTIGSMFGEVGTVMGALIGVAVVWIGLRLFRKLDRVFLADYLMEDYAYAAQADGAYPPELDVRLDTFAERITKALDSDADEVLLVGHSSGAYLAVSVLARVVRAGNSNTRLGLMTLGHVVPMVSLLPNATELREDLQLMGAQDDIFWLDVSAPGDGCAFALCHPVGVSGVSTLATKWPLVISARFSETLRPETWRKLRRRFFRLHFQYLHAFDQPGDYDYFAITAGPQRLSERFEGRAPSPSVKGRNAPNPRVPKPKPRPDWVPIWRYLKLFRADILSAQPERLYAAWMAAFKTPFFRSFLINDPALVREVLQDNPEDYPKSERVNEGLRPLLGNSVFVTNGDAWKRQRRIIDPAFEGGRLRDSFPAMQEAAARAVARLQERGAADAVEMEEQASHAAADVIFRTLFSIPIQDEMATKVFKAFRTYQRSQPILNVAAFVPLPKWMPRFHRSETVLAAEKIRKLLTRMCETRQAEIAAGAAPDDLATKIMTTPDPETGETFSTEEMVDQVAIFFLAGHETSASALGWSLWLLAAHPEIQERVAAEAASVDPTSMSFSDLSKLPVTRNVFREALRLYPPVPMMVRQNTYQREWRERRIPRGAQIVLSPWHLHRHERLWDNPDGFDPDRWDDPATKSSQQDAYMPFSAGPRVCVGAGFAMAEGVVLLSAIVGACQITPIEGQVPEPQAHLTVRARHGIWLKITSRSGQAG